eukprot:906831-Prymnesium_polylepis.2
MDMDMDMDMDWSRGVTCDDMGSRGRPRGGSRGRSRGAHLVGVLQSDARLFHVRLGARDDVLVLSRREEILHAHHQRLRAIGGSAMGGSATLGGAHHQRSRCSSGRGGTAPRSACSRHAAQRLRHARARRLRGHALSTLP